MALPLYLARTKAEMAGNDLYDFPLAYMSCHFSSAGPGLSNLPTSLPPEAMLILDDSTPINGHDPELIVRELLSIAERHRCQCLLLDFQRPGYGELGKLANAITASLPCSVAVSDLYATDLSCPVFLSSPPPDRPLEAHLAPWEGREVWLEAALDGIVLTLAESGCTAKPLWDFPEDGLQEKRLHCHYAIETASDCATFRLWRTREDLDKLLEEAKIRGVSRVIGLWQELASDT